MCYSRAAMCFAFPWTCALLKIPKFPSMLVFKNVVGCDFFFDSLLFLKLFTYCIGVEMQKFYCKEVHKCNIMFPLSVSKNLS